MFGLFGGGNIVTDEKIVEEFLSRGVDEVIDRERLKKRLMAGKPLRVKFGIDPTSPNIHLGRAVALLKLRDLQRMGHKIILLIGDATGVIGDTSDKDSERPMLTATKVKENAETYFEQMGKLVELSKVERRRNSDWIDSLTYKEIGEHADQFSVSDFIARDNIKRRLDGGKRVSLREVLYPLMQGYDSVALEADIELGGTDQRFNLLAGRKLQEHFKQNPQDIIMLPLLPGTDGRKMSSSWGNTINLTDEAPDMYGKVMSVADDVVEQYFVLATRVPLDEVARIKGIHPKEAKMRLAREIVTLYHGAEAAESAEKHFVSTFAKGEIPTDIPSVHADKEEELATLAQRAGIIQSTSEWRRLLEEGAVEDVDSKEKISDPHAKAEKARTFKIGKRRFLKVEVR